MVDRQVFLEGNFWFGKNLLLISALMIGNSWFSFQVVKFTGQRIDKTSEIVGGINLWGVKSSNQVVKIDQKILFFCLKNFQTHFINQKMIFLVQTYYEELGCLCNQSNHF